MKKILILAFSTIPMVNIYSQNVGIGTTSPQFKLDVKNGSINTDSVYRIGTLTILSAKGIGNISLGQYAGQVNAGFYNTFNGHYSGNVNSEGSQNSFFGNTTGFLNSTGSYNVAIGSHSLTFNTIGNYNSAFGYNAEVSTNNLSNATSIGANARVDCSNCMVLGSVAGINGASANVNVGIGATSPQYPLTFPFTTGDKISFYGGGGLPNADHYGIGVQGYLLQMFTPDSTADIALGHGRSGAFTENVRITGYGEIQSKGLFAGYTFFDRADLPSFAKRFVWYNNDGAARLFSGILGDVMAIKHDGVVGIGNTNPANGGLVVDKKVGAVNGLFGSNTTGVAIESNFPGIGLNSYYNAGRKTMSTGYTGYILFDPVVGSLSLLNSSVSTATGTPATTYWRLLINKDGNIGVEGNTSPHAPLSFGTNTGSKISLYGASATTNYGLGIQGGLLQLYTDGNASDIAFGYGGSATFTDNMRIKGNGDVIIQKGILLSKGVYNSGNTWTEASAGSKMIWYPKKAAFRAGYTDAVAWNDANIGHYSIATGQETIASGANSVAMGGSNTASGTFSFAIGTGNEAIGYAATAMNFNSTASGAYSFASGSNTTASGSNSTAMGSFVSTAGSSGCFIVGDNSTTTVLDNSLGNQMMMRFAGGYRLYTNSLCTIGAQMIGGGNSWVVVSDEKMKENFKAVDGEHFLDKISKFKLSSWNYKGQDPATFRHYGPMAQEFFAAFGKDEYGTIGNDTTINQADFDGINLIAIKALEKRTTELKVENEQLKKQLLKFENENEELKKSTALLENEVKETHLLMIRRINQIEELVAKYNDTSFGMTKMPK